MPDPFLKCPSPETRPHLSELGHFYYSGLMEQESFKTNPSSAETSVRLGKPNLLAESLYEPQFISALIHRIGHDIGNPLTSIISLATILHKFIGNTDMQDKALRYSETIGVEAWRISVLTEKLVLLLTRQNPNPNLHPVDSIFSRALHKLRTRQGIDSDLILLRFLEESVPNVFIDHDQAVTLFAELIENAVQTELHTRTDILENPPETPPILIEISTEGSETVCSIKNSSATPSPHELSNLFDPFVTTFGDQKKIGFGLTMAAETIARNHGSILLEESTTDGCTVFKTIVRIPNNAEAI